MACLEDWLFPWLAYNQHIEIWLYNFLHQGPIWIDLLHWKSSLLKDSTLVYEHGWGHGLVGITLAREEESDENGGEDEENESVKNGPSGVENEVAPKTKWLVAHEKKDDEACEIVSPVLVLFRSLGEGDEVVVAELVGLRLEVATDWRWCSVFGRQYFFGGSCLSHFTLVVMLLTWRKL